jgi:hypothetical protein
MLITERTKQALQLFSSYARTPEQKTVVAETFRTLLAESDNEDYVVLTIISYIFDGLRFGNWLWITPEARRAHESSD